MQILKKSYYYQKLKLLLFRNTVVFSVLLSFSACTKKNTGEAIPEDYAIYNQVLYQLGNYKFYIFDNSRTPKCEIKTLEDSLEARKLLKIIKSYGIDTSNINLNELKVAVIYDSLDGKSFRVKKPLKSIDINLKYLNFPKNTFLIKFSHYKKYIDSSKEDFNSLFYKYTMWRLSRIFFNEEKDQGMFFISYAYGPLSGSCAEVKVKFINSAWYIVGFKITGIF